MAVEFVVSKRSIFMSPIKVSVVFLWDFIILVIIVSSSLLDWIKLPLGICI